MKLRSFTTRGKQLVAECSETAHYLFPDNNNGNLDEELFIITPEDDMDSSENGVLASIHAAWSEIQSCQREKALPAWRFIRQYGQEIGPGLSIYHLRSSANPSYFFLLPDGDFFPTLKLCMASLLILSSWRVLTQGCIIIHAAGIVRDNRAYLFVGRSGAGKSTVSRLTEEIGGTIIHDDHVVIIRNPAGGYLLTNRTCTVTGVPLTGVFFLAQDATDQLVPLSALATARGLLDGIFDSGGRSVLSGSVLEAAFVSCAAAARLVPGYKLHFRQSPAFWNLIDAELRN